MLVDLGWRFSRVVRALLEFGSGQMRQTLLPSLTRFPAVRATAVLTIPVCNRGRTCKGGRIIRSDGRSPERCGAGRHSRSSSAVPRKMAPDVILDNLDIRTLQDVDLYNRQLAGNSRAGNWICPIDCCLSRTGMKREWHSRNRSRTRIRREDSSARSNCLRKRIGE
jgi:hypothetical protein